MGKLMRSKRQLHFLEKSPNIRIGNLFDAFLKLLYLMNYPFIHPGFISLSLEDIVCCLFVQNWIRVLDENVKSIIQQSLDNAQVMVVRLSPSHRSPLSQKQLIDDNGMLIDPGTVQDINAHAWVKQIEQTQTHTSLIRSVDPMTSC